ncbi:MAG TPA: MFS transporter [Steroidobacteraceae bacterium]|jgi:benzoate transport|nr:MFS transporter [Steroidobacteraceae bacterium]
MQDKSPKFVIDLGTMSIGQWLAVLVTVGLNAMDGFDVLSISFASPGIARDWGLDKATLGWVLSMELVGMALGSVLLGGVADKIGRRPTILGCLAAMTVGMFGASYAGGVSTLLVWRLLTGFGIGGMLASINAAVAELSSQRWRSLAVSLMVIGYPVGGVIGGTVVQRLLAGGTWHDVFFFGGWVTAAFIPIVWFLLPESVAFLDRRRKPGALDAINRILTRFRHEPVSALSPDTVESTQRSVMDILKPGLIVSTLLVTVGYFAHVISFYFIIKWVPKLVVDMGFAAKAAAGVLTWANVGGATGVVLFGLIATRVGLKALTLITLVGSSVMVVWFGRGSHDLGSLTSTVAIAGLFTNAAIGGYYMLFARVFPTHVRATGTGFAVGVGRGGALLAPVVAGYLLQAGLGLQAVATMMAMGSLCSAAALLALKVGATEPER